MTLYANDTVIHIRSANDLIKLAENCSLDTWSQNKVIELENDIDLTDSVFKGIPTFGGTFHGNGHIISGINMQYSGSIQGLFRYVQESGTITRLTVKGIVKTTGTKKTLGGIVGKNAGLLKNCTFIGDVEGDSYIGGIAGVNEATGKIMACHTQGFIAGEHYIGGIAGQNLGLVLNCNNEAKVNTSEEETSFTLDDLQGIDVTHINDTENTRIKTDIGGIAGFSTGVIQGCQNNGTIGYQHVGYNIGGIVGRQSGFINECKNNGMVFGRKDVGGIVGQMEPSISLEYSKDKVGQLRDELDRLNELMNKTLDDASAYSDSVTDQLDQTKGYVDNVIDLTSSLAEKTEDLISSGTDTVNDLSSRVSSTLDQMEPVLEEAEILQEKLNSAIDRLREASSLLEDTSGESKETLDRFNEALSELQLSVGDYTKAMNTINKAISSLKDSIGDMAAVRSALNDLIDGTNDLAEAFKQISKGMEELSSAMSHFKQWAEESEDWKNLTEGLRESAKALSEMSTATTAVVRALNKILQAADTEEVRKGLESLQQASKDFSDAAAHLQEALNASDLDSAQEALVLAAAEVQSALDKVNVAINAFQKAVTNEEVEAALKELEKALSELESAMEKAAEASEKLNKGLTGVAKSIQDGELSKVLEEVKAGINDISKGMKLISSSMEEIQTAIKKIHDQVSYGRLEEATDHLQQAIKELIQAGDGTDEVISKVKKGVDATKDTIKSSDKVLEKVEEATDELREAGTLTTHIVSSVHQIISDLAEKPELTFPKLDSEYMGEVNDLSSSMGNISDTLGKLNQIVGTDNELLIQDLHQVSAQFDKVIDRLVSLTTSDSDEEDKIGIGNLKDLDEYSEDISDEDTEDNTQGKVASSKNQGTIEGDVNVGGIVGAMAIEYDFDPEDDVAKKGKSSLKFRYLARAVVRACTNKGEVISKKNYVGGIAGKMDLGTIIDSVGYGTIRSNDGDYVGGIAGGAYSHIKQCFAMCILSGENNVGGIAGYAERLSDNYALVEIENAVERQGAIAGEVKAIKALEGNRFVSRGVAAVDSISYEKKAEPMSYEAFCKVEQIPEDFKHLHITFKANEKVVAEIPFEFGGSIDVAKLPEIPEEPGYYGKWPAFNFDHLTFSTTLEAIYLPYTQIVSSTESKGSKALALIEGTFGEDTVLSVNEVAIAPPKSAKKDSAIWQVMVSGPQYDTSKEYNVRLLAPSKGKVNVYTQSAEGVWEKIPAKRNGSYMMVRMNGDQQVFCLASASYTKEAVMATLFTLIVIIGVLLLRHRKKRFSKAA